MGILWTKDFYPALQPKNVNKHKEPHPPLVTWSYGLNPSGPFLSSIQNSFWMYVCMFYTSKHCKQCFFFIADNDRKWESSVCSCVSGILGLGIKEQNSLIRMGLTFLLLHFMLKMLFQLSKALSQEHHSKRIMKEHILSSLGLLLTLRWMPRVRLFLLP